MPELTHHEFAKKMTNWAIVALVLGLAGSAWLPNFGIAFGGNLQQVWDVIPTLGWICVQFGLPLSAVLFVGAMVVRRLPDKE